MLKISLDNKSGIVTYITEGLQTPDEITDDAALTRDVVAKARRHFGSLKMLIYKLDGIVQTREAMDKASRTKVYLDGDKIAIVVKSALLKMQLSRNAAQQERVFDNEAEAIAWLST